MAVPILPVEAFVAYQAAVGLKTAKLEKLDQSVLPQVFADQFGWPELVAGIARVYRSLPPEEQARAVVLGKNCGVASAAEILGPRLGLPRAWPSPATTSTGSGRPSRARRPCHRRRRPPGSAAAGSTASKSWASSSLSFPM